MEKLPEKWWIKILNQEHKESLDVFVRDNKNYPDAKPSWCVKIGLNVYYPPTSTSGGHSNEDKSVPKGYTEITFDQFKRLVLGETEEFIPKEGDWFCVIKDSCGGHLKVGDVRKITFVSNGYYLYFEKHACITLGRVRPARPEEIPQEEVEYYVEAIIDIPAGILKGEILICRGGKTVKEKYYSNDSSRFKPSTREAYEAQQRKQECDCFDGCIKCKKVNKCSTINTNQNECKNEKGSQTKSPLDRNTGAKTGQSIRSRTPSIRVICESGLLPSGKEVTRTIKSSPRVKAEIGKRFI